MRTFSISEIFFYSFLLLGIIFIFTYAIKVDYVQNDEWVHYNTVRNFLERDFTLDINIGSTFYAQAFIAYLFTVFFGISKLPILTAMVSVLTCYVFIKILQKKYLFKKVEFIALFLILNPIFVYLSLGFMIENYFLFYVLLSYYFYILFRKNDSWVYIFIAMIFAAAAFFTKQFGIVLIAAYVLHLFFTGRKTLSVYTFLFGLLLTGFYFFLFPRTPIMQSQGFNLAILMNPQILIQSTSNWLFTLTAFTLPVGLVIVISETRLIFSRRKKIINTANLFSKDFGSKKIKNIKLNSLPTYIAKIGLSLIVLAAFISSLNIIFPNLDNTFTNKGFFPGDLAGNKYQFKGWWDTFTVWKWLTVIAFISNFVIVWKTNLKSFSFLFLMLFFCFLLISPYFFDRYLVIALPFYLLLLAKILGKYNHSILSNILIYGFLVFLFCLNYLFVNDFLMWQNYVNRKTKEMSTMNQVEINENNCIQSTRALNKLNCANEFNNSWVFTFDSPNVLDSNQMQLRDTYKVNFIGNLFINSNVYLYEIKK